MAAALTFREFEAYALKHYSKGGDSFYECWDQMIFDDYVKDYGPITKSKALELFRDNLAMEREYEGWR